MIRQNDGNGVGADKYRLFVIIPAATTAANYTYNKVFGYKFLTIIGELTVFEDEHILLFYSRNIKRNRSGSWFGVHRHVFSNRAQRYTFFLKYANQKAIFG